MALVTTTKQKGDNILFAYYLDSGVSKIGDLRGERREEERREERGERRRGERREENGERKSILSSRRDRKRS